MKKNKAQQTNAERPRKTRPQVGQAGVFLSFVVKEARHILRDKRTMLILFGMPIALMLLFGYAITTDVKNVRTVVVASPTDRLTQQAVERLSASEYFTIVSTVGTPQQAERIIRHQQADMAIVPGPLQHSADHDWHSWQIMTDGADPNMAQQWATYASSILGESLPHPAVGAAASVRLLYNPQMRSAYNFVPAIMGMLLMLICAMMTSISIVREKERGTMEVLLVSPVKPLMVIVAKAVPYLVLAVGILAVILLMARFVLGVPLAGSVVWIVGVSLLYILLALSLGLLISTVARTQLVALLLSAMVLLMPVVMLSGMLFPVESMPTVLQWAAAIVPPRYYIDAMRKLMIMGVGLTDVAREVIILAAMTTVLLGVALAKFNKRLE